MRKFISKMKKTKSFDKVESSKKEFSRLYKRVVAYKSTIKKDLLFQMIFFEVWSSYTERIKRC